MHNPSEMIKQGYRPGAPSSKAEEIDAEVVDGTICKCGAEMQLVEVTDGKGQVVYRRPLASHALAYLDSG